MTCKLLKRVPLSTWMLFFLSAGATAATTADSLVQLRQAARGGDISARFQLGELYEEGQDGVIRDYAEAASWYREAAASGHTEAQRRLALMHLQGRGVPQSFDEAQELFFQAAQKNDEESQYQLGRLLLTGRAGSMSVETAITWFNRSAEAGHQGAQLELGRLYIEGRHTTRDIDRGLTWIRKSADQDHPQSQFLLASLYADGELVTEDPNLARSYFSRAAEAGLPDAQVWMAHWFESQDPPQYSQALRFYKRAADRDHAAGHFGVARLNLERLVYTPNSQEGLRHLRSAISLNYPEAHYTIARMYGNGSLSGGSSKALEHFQMAANLGYAPAMYELALAYYQGTPPLKKNPAAAARWWRQAAYAGDLESQYAFALLHVNGAGAPHNPGVAFALANIAAAQGHTKAGKLRDQLMRTLSADSLRTAQELSVQLFEKIVGEAGTDVRSNLK